MAIYRVGRASMDSQGYVTGTGGTKWREQLTLIRSGATIVFLTSPSAYATISEVIADDRMRVVSSAGKVVPESDYVILLHDSLTVDGLAQDVAETLRYYQGKETQFEAFIEFLKGFDFAKLEQLTTETRANAAAAADSQKKAQQNEINTAQYKDQAVNAAQGAEQNKTLTEQYKDRAVQAETAANQAKDAAAASQAAAKAEADRAAQITGINTVYDAIGNASIPFPDVWIPFNDGLQMLSGYGDEIKVGSVTVAKMVSFSRATTATYIDKSGLLRTAGVNEPRFENDGLLLEWQSTNICHSSSVTMTHWTKNSTPIIEPMGFYTKITPNAPGSGAYITPGTKLVIGNKYTFSFWAYSSSATCKVGIGVEKEYKSISQITNVKNRYSVTFVATQQSPTIVAYGGYDGFINEQGAFYIGGVQLEELPFASSLIQTSGAQVTRAPDLISIPTFLNAMASRIPITISANVTSKMTGITTFPRLLNLNKNENKGPYIDGIKNSWGGIVLSGTSSLSVRWSDRAYFVNGVKGSTFDDYDGEPIETSNILSDLSAPARGFFGNVRDFKIWHLSLTDEQIKAIR